MPQFIFNALRDWKAEDPARGLSALQTSSHKGFGNVVRAGQVPQKFSIDAAGDHATPKFVSRCLYPCGPQLIAALRCVFTQQHPTFVGTVIKKVLNGLFGREVPHTNVDDGKRRRTNHSTPG